MEKIKFPMEQSQIYLMKTIVGEESKAIEIYKKWIDSVNIDNYIDSDSYGMLPTLYKRLNSLGYRDKNTNRYLGIYKKSVFKNSMHFYNLQQIGQKLNNLNVPFGVLKGTAYTIKYHKDIGIRSMNDLDIFVTDDDMSKTVSILNELGFNSDDKYEVSENLDVRISFAFRNEKNFEVDLHWIPKNNSDRFLLMDQTKKFIYKNIELRLESTEDSILSLLRHASLKTYSYNIRWIFDLYTILSKEEEINWDKIISKVKDTRYPLVISIMLAAFNEISSINVPSEIINDLTTAGDNKMCKKHAKKCLKQPKTFLGKLGFYYYSQKHLDKSLIYRLVSFPGHVLAMSRFSTYSEMVKSFVKKYIFKKIHSI